MSEYYRCSHCRGFYEVELSRCKYCEYDAPLSAGDGEPRLFPDRETCRAVQIAEYEQLPPEAVADPMRPPPDELAEPCGCLHCGPGGPVFEAVEMRWIKSENMWACPSTTCGGRGYHFDVHPIRNRWECAECRHKWSPPDGNAKPSNCKCPKCGCTEASGWFDDEYSEEEIDAMTDEEYAEYFGITRAEEQARIEKFNREFEAGMHRGDEAARNDAAEEPSKEVDEEETSADIADYDPERRLGEPDADDDTPRGELRMPDDIDFPRHFDKRRPKRAGDGSGFDIPF